MSDRRSAIIETALDLLAQGGTKALSHRAIDRALEIPLGSTANYFPTRQSLVDATLDQLVHGDVDAYTALDPTHTASTPEEAARHLADFIHLATQGSLRRRSLALIALAVDGGVDLADYYAGQARGLALLVNQVRPDHPDPMLIAHLVVDYLGGAIQHIATGQRPADDDLAHTALLRLLTLPA